MDIDEQLLQAQYVNWPSVALTILLGAYIMWTVDFKRNIWTNIGFFISYAIVVILWFITTVVIALTLFMQGIVTYLLVLNNAILTAGLLGLVIYSNKDS